MLLSVPFAGALMLPTAEVNVEPFPDDIRDGDVLLMLGRVQGLKPARTAIPEVPADLTLSAMVMHLGARAGQPVAAEDAAAFDALDPTLQAPVLALLVAVDQAWTMRDAAFAGMALGEQLELLASVRAGTAPPNAVTPEQLEQLLNAAILLSDTIDSIVIPQLQAAADAGVWPASAIADPVGVLRIGGTGNDLETLDRIVQIDARGNDVYRNNAGGTTVGQDIDPTTLDHPIAVSLDLAGDDGYRNWRFRTGLGGGELGIGILLDSAGNDRYECFDSCVGSGVIGIGLLRDMRGTDRYLDADNAYGMGSAGIGIFREDQGSDYVESGGLAGGFGYSEGTGVLWDRAGGDTYLTTAGSHLWGYARPGGRGWFASEGAELDNFSAAPGAFLPSHTCNDCTWSAGSVGGRGNDNRGGLAALLADG